MKWKCKLHCHSPINLSQADSQCGSAQSDSLISVTLPLLSPSQLSLSLSLREHLDLNLRGAELLIWYANSLTYCNWDNITPG